jgi:3'5'-cyclic nucleotide phosphodiesterase
MFTPCCNAFFLCRLGDDEFRYVRRLVIDIILSTDMASHTELVDDFVANMKLLGPNLLDWPMEKRCAP